MKSQVQRENNVCKCALMACILSAQLCIFVKCGCAVQWFLLLNLVNGVGNSEEAKRERDPENIASPKTES